MKTDQIAMCIQTERVLEFTLLVPLIAIKFSTRIVVMYLTALLEYLHDCSIRVFNQAWITCPGTIITEQKNRSTTKSSAQIKRPGLY